MFRPEGAKAGCAFDWKRYPRIAEGLGISVEKVTARPAILQTIATQAALPPLNSAQAPESRKLKPPNMKADTAKRGICDVLSRALFMAERLLPAGNWRGKELRGRSSGRGL